MKIMQKLHVKLFYNLRFDNLGKFRLYLHYAFNNVVISCNSLKMKLF